MEVRHPLVDLSPMMRKPIDVHSRNVRRIADEFWELAGGAEPFPRSLEPAVFWALPLGVFKLPRLWIKDVELWLFEHGINFKLQTEDRPLHGCLIANNGRGCIPSKRS